MRRGFEQLSSSTSWRVMATIVASAGLKGFGNAGRYYQILLLLVFMGKPCYCKALWKATLAPWKLVRFWSEQRSTSCKANL